MFISHPHAKPNFVNTFLHNLEMQIHIQIYLRLMLCQLISVNVGEPQTNLLNANVILANRGESTNYQLFQTYPAEDYRQKTREFLWIGP